MVVTNVTRSLFVLLSLQIFAGAIRTVPFNWWGRVNGDVECGWRWGVVGCGWAGFGEVSVMGYVCSLAHVHGVGPQQQKNQLPIGFAADQSDLNARARCLTCSVYTIWYIKNLWSYTIKKIKYTQTHTYTFTLLRGHLNTHSHSLLYQV